jgi:hypothetical protein
MPENKAGGVGDVSWIRQNVWRVDSLSELGNDDARIKKSSLPVKVRDERESEMNLTETYLM